MPVLRIVGAIVTALAMIDAATAADRDVTIQFKAGTTSAVYRDRIKGYDVVNYHLDARAGQKLSVAFEKNRSTCYFNVLAPAGGDTIINGAMSDPTSGVPLVMDGRYRIVVYLMRVSARRGATCDYAIDVSVTD